jgi:hypothetical protein
MKNRMKKTVYAMVVAAFCFAFFAPPVVASTLHLTGDGGNIGGDGYGPYHNEGTGGGEFTFQPSTDLQWVLNYYVAGKTKNLENPGDTDQSVRPYVMKDTFQSFCLELDEYLDPYVKYNATLSDYANRGGVGGYDDNHRDYLSKGVAWLYYNFAKGTLGSYQYDGGEEAREASAGLLQYAIWYLEDEVTGTSYDSNIFVQAAVAKFGNLTNAKANSYGLYGVKVVNLVDDKGGKHQDTLVVTPIPAAVWLLGTGLLGLVGIRRRATV